MKHATALIVGLGLLTVVRPTAQQSSLSVRDLVGTWTLESTQQSVGTAQQAAVPNPRGLLIFDGAGHAFEAITRAQNQGQGGRGQAGQAPGAPAAAATPDASLSEAQRRFAIYSGFWGAYRLDGAQKRVSFKADGSVHPNLMGGPEFTRSIEITGDKLVMTSGEGELHRQGITRWTWERVPTVDNLTPGYRRVIGFWQHVVEKRLNLTTKTTLSETKRAPSIIVYSPSGYVGVHFPPLNRPRFAGSEPTDAEARVATMGYVGYFGALTVYPNMVFHQILQGLGTMGGNTLTRPFEISGSEVTIKFPPNTNAQGQQLSTHVTLRRLNTDADMLPAGR